MSFEDRFRVQKCLMLLDEDADMGSLKKRIKFQKTIYLLEAFGANLNYHFSWYLRGPYSTSLADDGYALYSLEPESRLELANDVNVDSDKVPIEKMKAFLKELRLVLDAKSESSRLELAASLHFLSNYTLNRQGGFEKAYLQLSYHKPRFRKQEAFRMWKLMEKYNLV
ncbi:MAG: hypothetical protein ACFFER_10445 [Candidatus Thorarchaeota archaeon]